MLSPEEKDLLNKYTDMSKSRKFNS